MTKFEKSVFAVTLLVPLIGHVVALWDPVFFDRVYTREDGVIESWTAVNLLLGALLSFYRVAVLKRAKLFLLCTAMGGLVLLFGAGEEISWGQRIFGFKTPEMIYEYNHQGEMNLHNLKFGEFSVNKVIFSQLLGLLIVFYFLPLPWFYRKKDNVRNLCARLALPVPKNWQILLFVLAVVLTGLIQENRKWEIMEFCGTMVFLTILIKPENAGIYARDAIDRS